MWKYSSFIFLWKDPVHKLPCNLGKSPSGTGRQKKPSPTFGAAEVSKILKTVFKGSSGRSGTVLSSHYALFHSLGLLADILRFIRWNKHFMISACFVWAASSFWLCILSTLPMRTWLLLSPTSWTLSLQLYRCNTLAFEILQYTTQKCKVCVQSLGHYNILPHKRLPRQCLLCC